MAERCKKNVQVERLLPGWVETTTVVHLGAHHSSADAEAGVGVLLTEQLRIIEVATAVNCKIEQNMCSARAGTLDSTLQRNTKVVLVRVSLPGDLAVIGTPEEPACFVSAAMIDEQERIAVWISQMFRRVAEFVYEACESCRTARTSWAFLLFYS